MTKDGDSVVVVCRRCGQPFGPDEQAFGSDDTGWEHPFASCPDRSLHAEVADLIRRGRRDGKRPEVVAHAVLNCVDRHLSPSSDSTA